MLSNFVVKKWAFCHWFFNCNYPPLIAIRVNFKYSNIDWDVHLEYKRLNTTNSYSKYFHKYLYCKVCIFLCICWLWYQGRYYYTLNAISIILYVHYYFYWKSLKSFNINFSQCNRGAQKAHYFIVRDGNFCCEHFSLLYVIEIGSFRGQGSV